MQGTIIMGDHAITFGLSALEDQSWLTVADVTTGVYESRVIPTEHVNATLIVAFVGDEFDLPEEVVAAAEEAQPSNPELRFIP